MSTRILLTSPIHEEGRRLLGEIGEVRLASSLDHDTLRKEAADADVLVVRDPLPADIFEHARKVRVVARPGIGVDLIPVEAATARGIPVLYTPYDSVQSVAEHTFALMLGLARQTPLLMESTRAGHWEVRHRIIGSELRGRTLGVVGFGNIGMRVAEVASSGFGMRVVAYARRKRSPRPPVEWASSLTELLEQADYVSLHVPLTPETRGMIGEPQLAAMPSSAYLINTSRGAVVDERALLAALKSGRLAGAALDVFEEEPLPADHPLLSMPNVIVTPHVAGLTHESMKRMGLTIARDIIRVLHGQPPQFLYNKEVLEGRQ